jgi:hypothetical protein
MQLRRVPSIAEAMKTQHVKAVGTAYHINSAKIIFLDD